MMKMKSVINKHMKVDELESIIKIHAVETAYGWQIVLWMLFNTFETDELVIEGFGRNAQIHPTNAEKDDEK